MEIGGKNEEMEQKKMGRNGVKIEEMGKKEMG